MRVRALAHSRAESTHGAGHALAIDRDHFASVRRGLLCGTRAGRPEAENQHIGGNRIGHTEAAVRGCNLIGRPVLIEQHACSCNAARPIELATANVPSAGKAMPSSPAMTA